MSESRNNVFSMLSEEDNNSPADKPVVSDKPDVVPVPNDTDKPSDSSDDSNWIVHHQKRRLAPQWTLSRHDLGTENPSRPRQPATSSSETNGPSQLSRETSNTTSAPKKKVLRFGKEELLSLRTRTVVLPLMKEFPDIASTSPLDPIALHPLEADEIIRLWNVDKQRDVNGVKAKVRTNKKDEDDESKGIWDDGGGTLAGMGTFDLSDMAAAALKFQSDTFSLSTLPKENLLVDSEEKVEIDNDESEDIPDWAREDAMPTPSLQTSTLNTNQNVVESAARKSLLEALHIQPTHSDQRNTYEAESTQLVESSEQIGPNPDSSMFSQYVYQGNTAFTIVDEWFYSDQQGTTQGPFTTENMKAWSNGGYFSADLPIKMKHWAHFHLLGKVFNSMADAFNSMPTEPVSIVLQHDLRPGEEQRKLLEQQRLHEQSLVEQMRIQQLQHSNILDQRREMAILDHRRQLDVAEEARRKEIIMCEQQRQTELLEEKRRVEQFMLFEADKQKLLLERNQRNLFDEQKRYQEQIMFENQRRQLEEQQQSQRQEHLYREQQRIQIDNFAEQRIQEDRRIQHEEQLRQERLRQEQIRHEHIRQEQLRQEQLRQDQYRKEQQLRQEQQRQEQLRQEQLRQEQLRQEQLRQEQLRHEQLRQEQLRQDQIRQEQHRQEQERQYLEQQRQREFLEEQRRKHELYVKNVEAQAVATSKQSSSPLAPWAQTQDAPKTKETLLEIQMREEAEALKQMKLREAQMKESMKLPGWSKSQSSISKSLIDIQLEEQRQREVVEARQQTSSSPSVSTLQLKSILGVQVKTGPGWTGAGSQSNMTLREIMEQEQEKSFSAQTESTFKPTPAGTWAAKASTGSNSLPQSVIRPQPKPQPSKASKSELESVQSIWIAPSNPIPSVTPVSKAPEPETLMSKEISDWCESQLKKINPKVEASLLQICFTFESAGDIREYVAELLGSTPQVSQFATEFIKRKEAYMATHLHNKKKKK